MDDARMLDRAEGVLIALARWVRARYPDWATGRGHLALVALCGRDGARPVSSERVTPS